MKLLDSDSYWLYQPQLDKVKAHPKFKCIPNEAFRQKTFRGAKIEDLIFQLRRNIKFLLNKYDVEGFDDDPQAYGILKTLEEIEEELVNKFRYEDIEEMK